MTAVVGSYCECGHLAEYHAPTGNLCWVSGCDCVEYRDEIDPGA